jgi:PPIC-type PPIASE domain
VSTLAAAGPAPPVRALALVLLACTAVACGSPSKGGRTPAASEPERSAGELTAQIGYPRASWRAAPGRLNPVRLRIAHILVGHAGSARSELGLPFLAERRARDRRAALELALELARTLEHDPDGFARLASRHSDDRVSREFGGELGVVSATELPAAMLDALAVLEIGRVSRVVETAFGFHILKRLPIGAEQRITARHIRIAHREVPDGPSRRRASRTREEAFSLAKQLYAELRAHPDRFGELARRNSDAPDAVEGGDLGTESSYVGADRALGFRLIEGRSAGAFSEPFETAAGIEIYQRVAQVEHARMVVRFIGIGTASLAQRIAADLARNPSNFEIEQQRHCPAGSCADQTWVVERGHEAASTVDAIERLAFGQVAAQPIGGPDGVYLVVRREDPARVAVEPERYETEMPEVDIEPLQQRLGSLDAAALSEGALKLGETAESELALNAEQRSALRALFQDIAERLRTAPSEQRSELIMRHQAKVLALIGPDNMATLHELREALWREAQMM